MVLFVCLWVCLGFGVLWFACVFLVCGWSLLCSVVCDCVVGVVWGL